jgi:hypothetical protein
LIRERWCLVSNIRSRAARGRLAFWRRSFSRIWRAALAASRWRCWSAARSRSRASCRFIPWERESCAVTLTFVGKWRRVTRVETLFTFWPPGPEARLNVSSSSASFKLVIGFMMWMLNQNPPTVIKTITGAYGCTSWWNYQPSTCVLGVSRHRPQVSKQWTPSPSQKGRRGRGRGGPFLLDPLSRALSPLVPRGARESMATRGSVEMRPCKLGP